ncbi:MAG TPA: hypothetical protein VM368_01245 [Flavisolibacter sp.]|nr:hypothetical protein [Flavisolibacter sp.]
MKRFTKKYHTHFQKSLLIIFFVAVAAAVSAQEQARYIFLNLAPGRNFKVGKPTTFNKKVFDDVAEKFQVKKSQKLQLGISVIFDFLSTNIDSVEKSLDRLLVISQVTDVPILIHLDGINWLNDRPDLWNWWDPKKPGYNPDNKKNVEWTDWNESSAIKISWRNWGTQFRTMPAPNIMSPKILEAQISGLNKLIPKIVLWYNNLPAGKKHLLGGVKLAHEASIGVNAYYYKGGNRYIEKMPDDRSLDPLESYNAQAGFNGGLTTLGYAAVKTAGIKDRGRITNRDLEQVVHRFLDTLSKTAFQLGLPKEKIYTHQGGTFAPWDKHLSFSAASNQYSLPGWSLYSTNPNTAGDLGDVLDSRKVSGWAAAEWWWPGNTKLEWKYNVLTTLSFKDCRFIAIFNWENGLEKYPHGIEAIKEVINEWN